MSDASINQFVGSVADAAARAAFTPSPPTPASGPANGYTLYQRDTDVLYSWDSAAAAWVQVGGGGANVVTAAGTLTASQLVLGAGSKAVAELGSLGTTTTVLHGNAAGAPTFGAVSLTADVTGDLPYANLAQGSALSVLGVTGNATADVASIAAGTDGYVLRRSGTALAFGTLASGAFPSTMFTPMVSVTNLTDAQIKALPTPTSITLVAAPGAGYRIKPLAASWKLNTAAGAYTNVNTTNANLVIQAPSGFWMACPISNDSSYSLTALTDLLTNAQQRVGDWILPFSYPQNQTANQLDGYTTYTGNAAAPTPTDVDNQPLELGATNNGAGAWTGGNAANSLRIVVYYTIEAL